jgi:predicted transglutaminase-like protease
MNISSVHSSLQVNSSNDSIRNTPSNHEINKFLLKAQNGTLSKKDLQDMQTKLSGISDEEFTESKNYAIRYIGAVNFLLKVKSGTVTDNDLQKIKALLNSPSPQLGEQPMSNREGLKEQFDLLL